MKPRTLVLIAGGVVVLACVCVAGFLALGAWASNDPETVAHVSATGTAGAVATQLASYTPTPPPGAKLVVDETFDSNAIGFQFINDNSIQTSLQDGAYQAHFGRIGIDITPLGLNLTNFIAEFDCKSFGYHAMCGLAFRLQDTTNNQNWASYRAYINNDYAFDDIPVSGPTSTTQKSTFARHPGDWNHMRIEVVAGAAKIYMNQELIDQLDLKDSSLSSGDIGILIGMDNSAENSDSADLTFDNLKIWQLP
jgi:hypothetical protein